ncbi:MAG TPA: site-specific integrase [Propionibacteriaceae bacterium]|nr:site-specific integrase [Propionibacteriaceae bacterium]
MPTAAGVPCHNPRQVRAASSPDPPGSSWRRIKGMSHAGSSRTPLRHACRTQTIWQYWPVPALSGLLPPSPTPLGSGCPQLHRPAATGSAAKVSHLLSNHSASRRTHDLRHFYASGLIASGCDVVTVQRALGHAKATTTLNTYAHLWPTAEDRTRAAAADLMASAAVADSLRTREGVQWL